MGLDDHTAQIEFLPDRIFRLGRRSHADLAYVRNIDDDLAVYGISGRLSRGRIPPAEFPVVYRNAIRKLYFAFGFCRGAVYS